MLATPSANLKIGNQLLNALPPDEYNKLSGSLSRVKFPRGKILYKPGEAIDFVYFPENSIVSTVTFFGDGASVETGITGNEGMAGVAVALSAESAQRETSVQAEGDGWIMDAARFRAFFEQGGSFQHLILRYIFAFFEQVAQSGACSHHHPIEQRLARWLLMCDDRTEGDEISITQDFLAQMLGVHRPGVTHAALGLKNKNLIDYKRGAITICDRRGLESVSCECYATIKKIYDHYLSILELQVLNRQLEAANQRMAVEIERRRTIQSTTQHRLSRLRNVVSDLQFGCASILVCAHCNSVKSKNGEWFEVDDALLDKLKENTPMIICETCKELAESKSKSEALARVQVNGRGK